jgi:hypothetical protein
MAHGLLITGLERRRSWQAEEREQILSEAFAPGAMASLIVTRRMNRIDPQAWLADVLQCIADHSVARLDELLPWN